MNLLFQVNVGQDLLPSLLHTARCYKIKGLDNVQTPPGLLEQNVRPPAFVTTSRDSKYVLIPSLSLREALWLKTQSAGRKQIPFPSVHSYWWMGQSEARSDLDWPMTGQAGSSMFQSPMMWDRVLSLNWGPHKNAIIPLIIRSLFSVSKSPDYYKLKINPDGFLSLLTFLKIFPE